MSEGQMERARKQMRGVPRELAQPQLQQDSQTSTDVEFFPQGIGRPKVEVPVTVDGQPC